MRRLLPALLCLAACAPPVAGGDQTGSVEGELNDPTAPVYPANTPHSPLTPDVIANLKATLQKGNRNPQRFSKIGDSMTVSDSFAKCFAKDPVVGAASIDRDDDDASLEGTRQYFLESKIGGTTSFDRVSQSATVGWMAVKAIEGNPTPLATELAATDAAFAVVMYGANDTYAGATTEFTSAMTKIVDDLLAMGVVPLLSTIPPRGDATANALVPGMNAVIRTVAEQKRVPLMDLWMEMKDLPLYGLGPDKLHPSSGGDGCQLTASGMQHGYEWRNLLLIEELDRMRTQILEASAPTSTSTSSSSSTTSTEGTCFSYTLQVNIDNGECVQSSTDDAWYQCVAGQGWVPESNGEGPLGPCTVEHPL